MSAAPDTPPAPFSLAQGDKRARLFPVLRQLTCRHAENCPPYRQMLDALQPDWQGAETLEALPWLPVGLFKRLRLSSVPDAEIIRELRSSGTTGTPSRILLDRPTAQRQSRALAAIVANFIGTERRPMLIIDRNDLVRSGGPLGARGAAVLGFSTFGRHHTYALTPDHDLDWPVIETFLAENAGRPLLVFGFTFMIWQHLVENLRALGRKLVLPAGSVLIHGGGWKKLADRRVNNAVFKAALHERLSLDAVHDYYGMAEQVGSIFMECKHGRLHVPAYAEAIVRDPLTLLPQPVGQPGVIQVLSELPLSYPGHSLLTEDIGAWLGDDDCPCGRPGRTFRVDGRLPRAEARGCSDAMATTGEREPS